jgi:hypothetical protein
MDAEPFTSNLSSCSALNSDKYFTLIYMAMVDLLSTDNKTGQTAKAAFIDKTVETEMMRRVFRIRNKGSRRFSVFNHSNLFACGILLLMILIDLTQPDRPIVLRRVSLPRRPIPDRPKGRGRAGACCHFVMSASS